MLDPVAVAAAARSLGISSEWATVSQVHGSIVRTATGPGDQGEGDALVTDDPGLPIAVRTADCVGVVAHGDQRVGVAHAGWRGLAGGVLHEFVDVMGTDARYYVGPSIGPCCYEVGPEVADRFPDHLATTNSGARSVDLRTATRAVLDVVEWIDERCTLCGPGLPSHRRDGTRQRIAAVGWL